MTPRILTLASTVSLLALTPALAGNFNRIASFPVASNMTEDQGRESSAEIISVTDDGMTLVYTDSPLGALGRIDITDPAAPKPLGNIVLDGEPTSVTVIGQTAYVGINTSDNYVTPSGRFVAFDVASGEELASCDLPGQPDSVAKAKDGGFMAVAIENERDEDLNDGALPQMPAGSLVLVDVVDGALACDTLKVVDVTGLAEIARKTPSRNMSRSTARARPS